MRGGAMIERHVTFDVIPGKEKAYNQDPLIEYNDSSQ
jgi:hypothetical protein